MQRTLKQYPTHNRKYENDMQHKNAEYNFLAISFDVHQIICKFVHVKP